MGFSGKSLELVKQKGVYPYEYMNSFKKWLEDKPPDRCEFFSSLKGECTSERYYFYVDVWIMFKMKTMGDYDDFYLTLLRSQGGEGGHFCPRKI